MGEVACGRCNYLLLMEREDQEQAGTRAPHNAGVLVYSSFPIDEQIAQTSQLTGTQER